VPVAVDGHEAVHQVLSGSVGRVRIGVDRPRLNPVDRESSEPPCN